MADMNDGIYYVEFSGNGQSFGFGVIVFDSGKINGGDPGFVYTGSAKVNGQQISAELSIKQWNKSKQSVFPGTNNYVLNVTGSIAPDGKSFKASGGPQGNPGLKFSVQGTFIGDLAGA